MRKPVFTAVVALLGAIVAASLSCLPVAVSTGASAANSNYSDTAQGWVDFEQDFRLSNLERQASGLPALDWCTEAYGFSPSMAMRLDECRDRVKRFEAGDHTALASPVLTATKR